MLKRLSKGNHEQNWFHLSNIFSTALQNFDFRLFKLKSESEIANFLYRSYLATTPPHNGTACFKNVNSCFNTNIYSYWWSKLLSHTRGARKLTGENLKVVWAEFSTLSLAILLCMQLYGIYRSMP